jgi:hypothetical protein
MYKIHLSIYIILHLFQSVDHYGFSKFIDFAMHLEKPKQPTIWNRERVLL